jgi:lipopolysaccharide/colanic/teichoic acid biosynthesis glycosyltransferase
MESVGDISQHSHRTGIDGRTFKAHKSTTMARDTKEQKQALKNLGLLDAVRGDLESAFGNPKAESVPRAVGRDGKSRTARTSTTVGADETPTA